MDIITIIVSIIFMIIVLRIQVINERHCVGLLTVISDFAKELQKLEHQIHLEQ